MIKPSDKSPPKVDTVLQEHPQININCTKTVG